MRAVVPVPAGWMTKSPALIGPLVRMAAMAGERSRFQNETSPPTSGPAAPLCRDRCSLQVPLDTSEPEIRAQVMAFIIFFNPSKRKDKIKTKLAGRKRLTWKILLLGNLWLHGQLIFLHGAMLKHQPCLLCCCFLGIWVTTDAG